MRGKAMLKGRSESITRITPAYAGKSFAGNFAAEHRQDHPRLCGEKLKTAVKDGVYTGSPPPMRGKGHSLTGLHLHRGITPAYAGKSSAMSRIKSLYWDHPRLCGEKTKKILKQRYFFHQPASFSFSLQYT